jgi:transposase-like protein
MKPGCPRFKDHTHPKHGPEVGSVIAFGSYFRACDSRRVARYRCLICGLTFSQATFSPRYRQKKRRIVAPLYRLMASTVSQRRAAQLLAVDKKTVVRYFRFIADQCSIRERQRRASYITQPLSSVQFDDLETSEHTKLKPLSVAIAVDPQTRRILGFQVSQMPARGVQAKVALRKYGKRPDLRRKGWSRLFKSLIPLVRPDAHFFSDQNPHYPTALKKHFPLARHETTPGGRGAVIGQGELKKLAFDPLFALNHTCAMLRANMNRLLRRTWCTTKKIRGLEDHLAIYVDYHNQVLTKDKEPPTPKGVS